MSKYVGYLIVYLILGLMVVACLLCNGCGLYPRQIYTDSNPLITLSPASRVPPIQFGGIPGLFLVAFGISIAVALYGFRKAGMAAAGGCLAALFLTRGMQSAIVYYSAGLIIVAVGGLLILSMFVKNKALKEIVCGLDNGLYQCPDAKETIKGYLKQKQSPSTQEIVKKIKKEI